MNDTSGLGYIANKESLSSELKSTQNQTISDIATSVTRDLVEMLQSMFDGIDDSFFELANNAKTNNEQNQFFEAMREIRIKRKGIERDFENILSNLFVPSSVFKSKKTLAPQPSNIEGLSLVKNDDLEEDVAITSMTTKALSNFQGPLLQFQTRICNLYGAEKLEDISPPLAPKDLSEGFGKACQNLEIELKERLIVYKQFDRYVLSNLGSILETANKSLIRIGIMPKLNASGIREKHGPKRQVASSPIRKPTSDIDSNNERYVNSETLPQLQSLLANIRTVRKAGDEENYGSPRFEQHAPTQLIETSDLIALLTAIQNTPNSYPEFSTGEQAKIIDIHTELKSRINKNTSSKLKQPKVNQTNDDLINLVAMLFEFILEDYNLAAPIQVLISRLQIPILKVVIQDNTFFSSSLHPARQLLNALAKAGIGWGEPQNARHDALYDKIHQTVHKILDEFTGDVSFFETLNKDFNEYMKKEDRKSRIVEQRTKESETGQAKSKYAQSLVEKELDRITTSSAHPIPEIISDILKNGWSRVMFLAYLKDEKEHQWKKSCQTARDLVWCLQPLKAQKDRQRWIAIAPKLLKDIKSGLEEVSYSTSNLDETILEIRTTLTSTFKNANFNSTNQASREIKNTAPVQEYTQSAVEKQIASKDTVLDEYISKVELLEPGTWLEFSLLNGNKYRCKLSTIISEADCYIFVNRMGLKTVEKNKIELSEDLKKGQVIILEQGLLMDRAINTLTSNLRKKASL